MNTLHALAVAFVWGFMTCAAFMVVLEGYEGIRPGEPMATEDERRGVHRFITKLAIIVGGVVLVVAFLALRMG